MMAVLAVRIEASPEQPDATALEVRREHVRRGDSQAIAPRMAHVEHE